jgi:hypothetical protein
MYACDRLTVSFGSASETLLRLAVDLTGTRDRNSCTVCQKPSLRHWYCDSRLTAATGSSLSTHTSSGNIFTRVTNDRWNLQRASRASLWKILHTRARKYSVFILSLSSSYEEKILVKISVICRQWCMTVWLSMSSQTKIRVRASGTIKDKSMVILRLGSQNCRNVWVGNLEERLRRSRVSSTTSTATIFLSFCVDEMKPSWSTQRSLPSWLRFWATSFLATTKLGQSWLYFSFLSALEWNWVIYIYSAENAVIDPMCILSVIRSELYCR